MSERIDRPPHVEPKGRPARAVVACVLLALTVCTLLLRVWHLNTIPPGLFIDEAAYGEDVNDILNGKFLVFFPRMLGHEPLFNYLAVPFVALWNGKPVALRLVSALMGTLMVPALYLAGKALWREHPRTGAWAGLTAAALWATNYWPQSVNRIAFHVNTMPLVVTLAVVAWLNWSRRPTRRRAVLFGILAGLSLATYLAARITPVLWLLLYLTLPRQRRTELRPTLAWAFLAFCLTVAPLAVHFALHPGDLMVRVGTFDLVKGAGAPADLARVLLNSTMKVAGVFLGGVGDPNPRHNLPGRAPFPIYLALLFAVGFLLALWKLRRREQCAWTLLLWLAALSLPAVLAAEGNPHFLRLSAALPAALLLIAWPVASLGDWLWRKRRHLAPVVAASVILLTGLEGVRTARDYFVTWAKETDLYYWYSQDIWLLGQRISQTPGAIGVVPLGPTYIGDYREFSLDYSFRDTPILQMQVHEADIEEWLADHLGNAIGSRVIVPVWRKGWHVAADPKGVLAFYLTREASLESRQVFRGFDLLTFSLDRVPQFQAIGHVESPNRLFSSTLALTTVRWGVGYPDLDRSGTTAAAGTPIWAILTWRLERPSPDLKVTLDLVDDAGYHLGSVEVELLNEQKLPVSQWEVGTESQTYHLIYVPATQLPGQVALETRAYDAQTLVPLLPEEDTTPRRSVRLGAQISITAALQPQAADTLSVARPVHAALPSGITLLGLDAWPAEIAPGQALTLRLLWEVESPPSVTETYTISLGTTGVSATTRLPPDLPAGQVVHTYVDLDLPPEVATGIYDLLLTSQEGSPPLQLGEVTVAGRPHLYQAPPLGMPLYARFGNAVTLLGADIRGDLAAAPGQPLAITLVWQVLGTPEQELVRFVHLLGTDGHIVAQEDTVPCTASCPAPSWLPGEILVDEARLSLPSDLPSGSYTLAVGWYDPATPLQRLPASDRDEQPLPNDAVVLPVRVVVGP